MWIYISIYVCTNEDGYILYLQDSYHRGYDESMHTQWKMKDFKTSQLFFPCCRNQGEKNHISK